MFNAITGKLVHKGLDSIHVESHGIEWEILAAPRHVAAFGEIGETIRVLVWLLHREDSMKLFGFASEQDRTLFHELIKVNGIGPKQALKILSGISAAEFAAALSGNDTDRLERIPGIGKKTAQNIIVSLKGTLPRFDTVTGSPAGQEFDELIAALADLGYDKKRCAEAVARFSASDDFTAVKQDEREQWLFHKALVALSTGS